MTRHQALALFWAEFVDACADGECWGAGEIDTEALWDVAVKNGLAERVAYDPEKHPNVSGDCEPGQIIYRVLPLDEDAAWREGGA